MALPGAASRQAGLGTLSPPAESRGLSRLRHGEELHRLRTVSFEGVEGRKHQCRYESPYIRTARILQR